MFRQMDAYPATGQTECHGTAGNRRPCAATGEDAEFRRGAAWPSPRFALSGEGVVVDHLTGLRWPRCANLPGFPLTWDEALAFVADLNRNRAFAHADWRLPNRRELRSLVSHATRRPALPPDHPFTDLFLGWYWSSTTATIAPAHAWYVDLDGGRLFYGGKDQSFMTWPVSGPGNGLLAATGQRTCHDADGLPIPCAASGQDGEYRVGRPWPVPRFVRHRDALHDRLTGLVWKADADLAGGPVTWEEALARVAQLGRTEQHPWRLPNVNELDLLVDSDRAAPALPADAGFDRLGEGAWSATTSAYEPDWAWALYIAKGAIGVGQKKDPHFGVMAVRDAT